MRTGATGPRGERGTGGRLKKTAQKNCSANAVLRHPRTHPKTYSSAPPERTLPEIGTFLAQVGGDIEFVLLLLVAKSLQRHSRLRRLHRLPDTRRGLLRELALECVHWSWKDIGRRRHCLVYRRSGDSRLTGNSRLIARFAGW